MSKRGDKNVYDFSSYRKSGSDGPPPDDPDDPGPAAEDPKEDEPDERPVVHVRKGRGYQCAEEILAHLLEHGEVYQRGGQLVRPAVGSKTDLPKIVALTPGSIAGAIDRRVMTAKYDRSAKGLVACDAPDRLLRIMIETPWGRTVPPLEGISPTPPVRPDGSIRWVEGYDPETAVYYAPVGKVAKPQYNRDAAVKARERLVDLVGDFPWGSDVDREAWLAGLLVPLVRQWCGQCPILAITSTTPRSGKSLLSDVIGATICGRKIGTQAWTDDQDEAKKTMLSIARAGSSMVLWDNLPNGWTIKGRVVDMAITSGRISDRILGKSEMADAPLRVCWYATGNNLSAEGDTAFRTIISKIVPQMEHPEERDDMRIKNLFAHVRSQRSQYLSDALSIIAGYLRSQRTAPPRPLGGFEGWSDSVRASLIWAGGVDVIDALASKVPDADGEADIHRRLLVEWERACGTYDGITVRNALEDAADDAALKVVISEFAPPSRGADLPTAQRLGARLKKIKGRIRDIDGRSLQLRHCADRGPGGAYLWGVVETSALDTTNNGELEF